MAVTANDWLMAQYSVIGSALIDSETVPAVVHGTTEEDFSGPCKTVYQAIRELFLSGAAVDPVSVAHKTGSQYREFIAEVMAVTPTAANVTQYIALCREQARILAIRDIGAQLATCETAAQMQRLMEQANGRLVERSGVKVVSTSDALRSFMDRHSGEAASYLTWPVRELDDRIYTEPGDFIILGGYPSTGKSAWALQCAWHWARQYKVGFFSLETSSEKLFDRMMASTAQLGMDKIKKNELESGDWDRLCGMTPDITSRTLELVPAAGMTAADVRAVTMMRGYQIIFVDYLQLLQASGGNRTEQVTAISIALHTLAQSLGVTVVALSQLAREGKDGGTASMDRLRESGQIEQDADVVMILRLEHKDDMAGNRELHIVKNKEGTCPKVLLAFDGKHQTFTKASGSGSVAGKYQADGNRARRRNRASAGADDQMTLLPDDTDVPF